VLRRNPFLSRAGFNNSREQVKDDVVNKCRNPFLSRAGFNWW
jgi:hypothetical protein